MFGCGLFAILSPPMFYLLGFGGETSGHVMRDNHTVRYHVDGQRYIGVFWHGDGPGGIWGMPVRVHYLIFAPGMSWLVDEKWEERAMILLVPFFGFVVLPLMWLWWTTIIRPSLQAWRAVRSSSDAHSQNVGAG